MLRRIFAWILLIGFLGLMLNLVFGFFNRGFGLIIYIIVVVAFITTNKGIKPR